jgi:DNA polymerase IV
LKRILHIDMDAFFAAVEQKRQPELIGLPVVIGGSGDPTKRGVVATASYEARKFGIHSAMPLKTAYGLCPKAVFLPVDYEAYARESHKVKSFLRGLTPDMEDVGIDEAFLDISEIDKTSEEISQLIKKAIRDETGLTCSIGIAPNKLLAKIASDMDKPDGLTVILAEDVLSILNPLPVRKLWGVGPKTEKYLKDIGIETVGELAALPIDRLVDSFGSSYGNYLYHASRGIDDSPLITDWEPKSISRETTFQKDIADWQFIAKTLADLTREVVTEMKDSGVKARTVTVKIRFSDFETVTRATTIQHASDKDEALRKTAFACLKRVELKKRVRLIGMRASHLERTGD